ncbi:MAG: CAP domain-containing protein [Cenarchaeum sp. SB0665_bin_23]|nr:CAP domain-containing protein [Cenarchaeum sp. SB0665_bin_23]MXZ93077.1 CAP domain-containing protein [Cenarchaeum sp. SB0666_bin_15]MYD58705.1 CAP domain-containing protein [Cenarchaeum sp. SB0678_bin_8]MYG32772.1 CAP domain-containing protein [Cenarchaeum sp. SB0677_bin_16]
MPRKPIILAAIVGVIGIGLWSFFTYAVPEIVSDVRTASSVAANVTEDATDTITGTLADVVSDTEDMTGAVTNTVVETFTDVVEVPGAVTNTVVETFTDVVEVPGAVTDAVYTLLPNAFGPYALHPDEGPLAPYSADIDAEESTQGDPDDVEFDISSIDDYIDGPMISPDEEGFVKEIELYIYLFTNIERESTGLDKLQRIALVEEIAKEHSRDMADRNYFRHVTPEGLDPTDRVMRAGYDCTRDHGSYYVYGLAENISWVSGIEHNETAQDIARDVVASWMNSPGHRANILEPNYNRLGVGVAFSEDGKMYATQNFC